MRVPALKNLESNWTVMEILKRTVNQGSIPVDSDDEELVMLLTNNRSTNIRIS